MIFLEGFLFSTLRVSLCVLLLMLTPFRLFTYINYSVSGSVMDYDDYHICQPTSPSCSITLLQFIQIAYA